MYVADQRAKHTRLRALDCGGLDWSWHFAGGRRHASSICSACRSLCCRPAAEDVANEVSRRSLFVWGQSNVTPHFQGSRRPLVRSPCAPAGSQYQSPFPSCGDNIGKFEFNPGKCYRAYWAHVRCHHLEQVAKRQRSHSAAAQSRFLLSAAASDSALR